eukprot:2146679-Prymnesium_polylepis.1
MVALDNRGRSRRSYRVDFDDGDVRWYQDGTESVRAGPFRGARAGTAQAQGAGVAVVAEAANAEALHGATAWAQVVTEATWVDAVDAEAQVVEASAAASGAGRLVCII